MPTTANCCIHSTSTLFYSVYQGLARFTIGKRWISSPSLSVFNKSFSNKAVIVTASLHPSFFKWVA